LYFRINDISVVFNENCPITFYSRTLIRNLPNLNNKIVVDFGLGSGIISILCSKMGAARIIGIEKNPNNIYIAKENIIKNKCSRIEIYENRNFYNEIEETEFADIILCNPASLPSIVNKSYCSSGKLGLDMIFEVIEFSQKFLKKGGEMYFLQTSIVPFSQVNKKLANLGFKFHAIKVFKKKFRRFYQPLIQWIEENRSKYPDIHFVVENNVYYELIYLYKVVRL
jgi:release factor glutamine methyltransferase